MPRRDPVQATLVVYEQCGNLSMSKHHLSISENGVGMYEPTDVVTTEAEVRQILGEGYASQVQKVIDHIDDHCRKWIERSPFIVVASFDRLGMMDVSPKGDAAGFVRYLDPQSLAIPDRPGNRRGDTFFNILQMPRIGVLFIVPKRKEVLRVSGSAQIVRDRDLLNSMASKGRVPALAVLLQVEEAMFHCGKSITRSGLWEPSAWGSVEGLPTYAQALIDHAKPPYTVDEMATRLAAHDKEFLY